MKKFNISEKPTLLKRFSGENPTSKLLIIALSIQGAALTAKTACASTFGMPTVVSAFVATGVTTKEEVKHNLAVYKQRAKLMIQHIARAKRKDRSEKAAQKELRALIQLNRKSLEAQTAGLSEYIPTDLGITLDSSESALNSRDYDALQGHVMTALKEIYEVEGAL